MTRQAAQQSGVYRMALTRHTPFGKFPTNDLIKVAAGIPHPLGYYYGGS